MTNIIERNVEEIDLFDLIGILVRNIKTISFITVFFMVLVLTLSILSIILPPEKSFMPNEYSPQSIVMLNSSEGGNSFDAILAASGMTNLAGIAGLSGGTSSLSDSELAMELVKTYSFIDKINSEFELDILYKTIEKNYPRTELKKTILKKLTLSEDENTGLLTISYTDTDKILATEIVNKVTDLLEDEFNKIDTIRNRTQLSVVEEKKSKVEYELDRLQQEILNFQKRHNLVDVNVVFSELMKQVAELQSQLLMKNVSIDSYSQISSIKDPGYLKLVSERDAIENAIKIVENGENGDYPPLNTLPELSLELEYLKRELDVQATVYKSLITQIETLKLTADGTGPTFQVIEKARTPEIKSGPSRGKICIVVSVIGFFFSIFFVILKEFWSKIKDDEIKMNKLKGLNIKS